MVKIRRTYSFLKDYRSLPPHVQKRVDKQIVLLLTDPKHPSLRLKRLKVTDKLEVRITKGYRMTLRYLTDFLELRRVGTHDILRREG